jgi:hypothetical protein
MSECSMALISLLVLLTSLTVAEDLPIPEQVHIALAEDPHSMVVQWVTMQQPRNVSLVQYGTASEQLNLFAMAETEIFDYNGIIRIMHTAFLTNLLPFTVYCMQFGMG